MSNHSRGRVLAGTWLCLFLWLPSTALAQRTYYFAESHNLLLQADEILYDQQGGRVEARGRVEAIQGDNVLQASRIIYWVEKEIIEAFGPIRLAEDKGAALFANSAMLTRDFSEGQIESIVFSFADGSRLVAGGALRKSSPPTDTLFNAAYTPCSPCKQNADAPSWDIQAGSVIHNREGQVVSYRNAVIRFFGLPVFYLPFFWHPGPEVERQSGLLVPRIGFSDYLGANLAAPFLINLGGGNDLRLTPFLASEARSSIQGRWRQGLFGGSFQLSGSIAELAGRGAEVAEEDDFRGHLFGRGRFPLGWGGVWGFDLQSTSDDLYLRQYDIDDNTDLASKLFAEWTGDGSGLSLSLWRFESLLEDENDRLLALPSLAFTRRLPGQIASGTLLVRGDLTAIRHSDETPEYRRFSTGIAWEGQWHTAQGSLWRGFARMRGDFFFPSSEGTGESNTQTRLAPLLGVSWHHPFIRRGEGADQVIEPFIQFALSPYHGMRDEPLPNEDSPDIELNQYNLLAFERFAGFDRVEEGARAHIGVNISILGHQGGQFLGFVGQGFRPERDTPSDDSNDIEGFEESSSDYIAALSFAWPTIGAMNHKLRINRGDLSIHSYEADADLWIGPIALFVDYTRIENEDAAIETQGEQEQEEAVYLAGAGRFLRDWQIYGEWRYDLARRSSLGQRAGWRYEDECLAFDLAYEHDFTRDRDIEPDTRITLRVGLRNLGGRGVRASIGGREGSSFY